DARERAEGLLRGEPAFPLSTQCRTHDGEYSDAPGSRPQRPDCGIKGPTTMTSPTIRAATPATGKRPLRFAIIGAGMAGILSAIKLQAAGLDDFTIYEKGERVGGTWRENTYPGIACDVPSHLYSYSFAPNPDWTHVFSPGPEIREYLEAVAQRHDVERLIRYNTEVSRLEFTDGRWQLETATGERDEFDVVIA